MQRWLHSYPLRLLGDLRKDLANELVFSVRRHVPKAKATIVADTPEMKRLAANSKIQSNVQYHAEFEASKSKFTVVADDPESKRLAANTRTISNITYHGLVEQKEEQEKKRSMNEGEVGGPVVQLGNYFLNAFADQQAIMHNRLLLFRFPAIRKKRIQAKIVREIVRFQANFNQK